MSPRTLTPTGRGPGCVCVWALMHMPMFIAQLWHHHLCSSALAQQEPTPKSFVSSVHRGQDFSQNMCLRVYARARPHASIENPFLGTLFVE